MINEGLTVVEPHSKLLYALCFKACSEHMYTLAPGLVQSTYIRFAQDLFRAYVHALRRGVYCKMFF